MEQVSMIVGALAAGAALATGNTARQIFMTLLRGPDLTEPLVRIASGEEFHVGRDPDMHWTLPDPDRVLSKRHFFLALRGGEWQVTDTSTNGTYLNSEPAAIGHRLSRPLRDGDRLRVGSYQIGIRLNQASADDARLEGSPTVADAYQALRHLIADRYDLRDEIAALEQDPTSESPAKLLIDRLAATGVTDDAEVMQNANNLTRLLAKAPREDPLADPADGASVIRPAPGGRVSPASPFDDSFDDKIDRTMIADEVGPRLAAELLPPAAPVALALPPTPSGRTIDAHLLATAFIPGQIASLTVTLRVHGSSVLGQFSAEAEVSERDGPVTVALEAHGFTILSQPPAPLEIVAGRDTAPAAFQLLIENLNDRWLHIIVTQAGRQVGELAINDFKSVSGEERRANAQVRSVQEADLTLIVRAAETSAVVCSPRHRASLEYQTIPGITPLATPFRAMLRDRLRALYDPSANAAEIERELQVVGVELARCLSPQLTSLLRRPDVRTVMLRHDEEFEFPLELCFLDDAADPFFVGDRIAICRWYLGVTNPPDVVSKRVGRVAFLRGGDAAAAPDEAMLNRLYPNRTTTLSTSDAVRNSLFKTSDFDMIQFTGHCKVTDKGLGGLEMADGNFVRIVDIGQLMAERKFTTAQPFVLLNACASAQPYVGLTNRDSFAHRFVTSEACAFIGTLWPVAGAVANDFAAAFHEALRSATVGGAMLAAKLAVVSNAAQSGSAAAAPDIAAIARQVAARSYCLFAHPDLRLDT